MRIVCVWREASDYGREVRGWLDEFERRTGVEVESLDPDTREGAEFARLVDVVEYPTIVVVDEKGTPLESWRGTMLPQINQVAAWLNN